MDLIRVGGKDVEGTFVVVGPGGRRRAAARQQSEQGARHAVQNQYEKAYGTGSANQFAGHAFDVVIVLQKAVPMALKKAKPGTPEFRAALNDAIETMGRTPVSQGVLQLDRRPITAATRPRPACCSRSSTATGKLVALKDAAIASPAR